MDWNLLLTDLPTLVAVIVGVPAVLAAYIVGGEFLVRRLPDKNRPQVRPWIWVGPALLLVTGFLVVPAPDGHTQLHPHHGLPPGSPHVDPGRDPAARADPTQQPCPHRRRGLGHRRLFDGDPVGRP